MQTVYITPNEGKQKDFLLNFSHRFVGLEGGWGSGKTWAGSRKLMLLHLMNNKVALVTSAILAPTFSNARDFVIPAISEACDTLKLPYVYKRADNQFEFPTTQLAPIIVRTADAPERITGWEVGAYWCDEPARYKANTLSPKDDPLTQIVGRLRHPKAKKLQGIYTYTNEGDHTTIYQEFHSGSEDHALYRVPTYENPIMQDFSKALEKKLSRELARQYIEGEAISLSGQACCPAFDQNVHIDDTVVIRPDRPLHVSFDFNIAPGMHVLIGQSDNQTDQFWTTHEIYRPRLDVKGACFEVIEIIKKLSFAFPSIEIFGDATGKSEWAGTSHSCYDIVTEGLRKYFQLRVRVPKMNPLQTDRVNALNMALQDFDGQSHWSVHSRCQELITDMGFCRWDNKGKISERDKMRGHSFAAEGYRVHYLRPIRTLQRDSESEGRIAYA